MGYITGTGLGKQGEGRVEPVEALLLPEGHISLDKVMELKQKKLLKKLKDKKLKEKKNANKSEEKKEELDVFQFINETLISKSNFYSILFSNY